jgi:hypothetical protein
MAHKAHKVQQGLQEAQLGLLDQLVQLGLQAQQEQLLRLQDLQGQLVQLV